MKRVRFLHKGFETVMTDEVAAVYEKKGKVEILGDAEEPKEADEDQTEDLGEIDEFEGKDFNELRTLAKDAGINTNGMNREKVVAALRGE